MRTILLLLSAALCGCASKRSPSPQAVDARSLCQQLAQASASSRELRSDAYFDQCMIANSHRPPWGHVTLLPPVNAEPGRISSCARAVANKSPRGH
jgi:hypothetical protein